MQKWKKIVGGCLTVGMLFLFGCGGSESESSASLGASTISGKTVYSATENGGYSVYSFNADGTGTYTTIFPTAGTPYQITWKYSVSPTTQSYDITLAGRGTNSHYPTPASSSNHLIMAALINPEHWYIGSTAQADALTCYRGVTQVTTKFTTALLVGKTATMTDDSGSSTGTFSTNGAYSNGTYSGTWSIDSSGVLHIILTSVPSGTSYPSLYKIRSGSGNSLDVLIAHNDTPTTWEPGTSKGINFVIQ